MTRPSSSKPSASSQQAGVKKTHAHFSSDRLTQAVQLHQQGEYAAARKIYEQMLTDDPHDPEAWHLLGLVEHQQGNSAAGAVKIEQALQLSPGTLLFRKNLASVYSTAGQPELAREQCEHVLKLEPDEPVMHHLLGQIEMQARRWRAAADHFRLAGVHFSEVKDQLECLVNLGDCLSKLGQRDQARSCFEQILQAEPRHLIATHNLAREYQFADQQEKAVEWYEKTLQIDPRCASAWNNLGVLHQTRADFLAARECMEKALELAPTLPDVHNNLANVLEALGEPDRCRELFEKAIQLRPEYPEAYHSLSQLLLREEKFSPGWDQYQWRLKKQEHDHRYYKHPVWEGQATDRQSLLVYAEQGIGDLIMFATCLPEVIERVRQVTIETDPRLTDLFKRTFPTCRVMSRPESEEARGKTIPGIDLQISLAELPRLFRRSADDFEPVDHFLKADPDRVVEWQKRFEQLGPGLRVGLSWFGGKNLELQARRAIPLTDWKPILKTPGVHFINLQYGVHQQDRIDLYQKIQVPIHDWDDSDPLTDLEDFAAKVAALDLVISIDNATVHFAGALGVACWCLLTKTADWRWSENRDDSYWYKSLHLFRQQTAGNWSPVITSVAGQLARVVQNFPVSQTTASLENSNSVTLTDSGKQAGQQESPITKTRPRCAVISPVGPGHQEIYRQAESSIRDACLQSPGPFREVTPIRIDDLEGKIGRSRARNHAVRKAAELGFDWVFFLDADDLMTPGAFAAVAPYLEQYDAIWGQIYSFQDGTNQAEQRAGQLGKTDRLQDLLHCDPFLGIQMGHFVKTEVALQHPFDEALDAGEDYDYYLRVWEKHRCIKIDQPLFANRRGLHSQGPRSATGRDWTVAVNRMIQQYRDQKNAQTKSVPADQMPSQSLTAAAMRVAIYGMMRSGTTLLCDKLTVPEQGLILLEPNIHLEAKPDHIQRQLTSFGIHISSEEWERGIRQGFQKFFDARILPELQQLSYWGVKMVNFTNWREFLQKYPTEHLVLCVRDIRDVILSALDLAPKLESFVDESWIEKRALETAAGLAEMAECPHILMRYEEFCRQPELIQQMAQQVGISQLGAERLGLTAVPHRLYEEEKHGGKVSEKSIHRYLTEPSGPARDLAERVWKQSSEYCRLFGYPVFGEPVSVSVPAKSTAVDPVCSVPDRNSAAAEEHPIAKFWKQDQLANIIPQNNQLGAFPEGWDVRPFLWDFVKADVKRKLVEVGCGYGRLCQAFPADEYLGVDINLQAVEQARVNHPAYEFETIGFAEDYPAADVILLYTVLLHIDDESIGPMLGRLCQASDVIVIAEILGRERWRRGGNPPVFNRDLQDYISLMNEQSYRLANVTEKPYEHYPQTNISFLKFTRMK